MTLTVRLAEPADDAAAVAAIYAPAVRSSIATFEETPPDAVEMSRRMAAVLERTPWLVAVDSDDAVIGYAYAALHKERIGYRWSVDVSVYVAAGSQRRGVGRALYERLLDFLRRQGYVNAYAGIALPNPASVALHEGIGMERIGTYRRVGYKHGAWHDVAWFGMRLLDPADPPPEPIPISRLAGG